MSIVHHRDFLRILVRCAGRPWSRARLAFLLIAALGAEFMPPASGRLIVRELFDDLGHAPGGRLGGRLDGDTSLGFDPHSPWQDNCSDYIKFGAFDVVDDLPGLPPSAGKLGGLWSDQWVFPNRWQIYDSRIWDTRQLAPAAQIHFDGDGVYYFTVRLNNAGDSAGGIGLASTNADSGSFIGAGLMWDTVNQAPGNYVYLTCGNLAKDTPYSICAHGPPNAVNGRCLLLGRLTTRTQGGVTMDAKVFLPHSKLPENDAAIDWDATCHFKEKMTATHLLVWMNGTYPFEIDAIRIGTEYADMIRPETVSQANSVPPKPLPATSGASQAAATRATAAQ